MAPVLPSGSPDQLDRFKSDEALELVRRYYDVKHRIMAGSSPSLVQGARIIAGQFLVMFDMMALSAYQDGLSNPVMAVAFRRQANTERVCKLLRQALDAEILARSGPITCKFCGMEGTTGLSEWKCKGPDVENTDWCCPVCVAAGKLAGEKVAPWPPPDPNLN